MKISVEDSKVLEACAGLAYHSELPPIELDDNFNFTYEEIKQAWYVYIMRED